MFKLTQIAVLPLVALATLFATTAESSAQGRIRAVAPRPDVGPDLPRFGMNTFNDGYGECITSVRYGGVAWRLGLERGDQILAINDLPLRYQGAWWTGLQLAMDQGGHVLLTVRNVRSGRLVHRHVDFPVAGPVAGPVTPKVVNPVVVDPVCTGPVLTNPALPNPVLPGIGLPGGPVTPKFLQQNKFQQPTKLQQPPVAPKFKSNRIPTAAIKRANNFQNATQQFAKRFGWQ